MDDPLALADRQQWAASQFATADLGDQRRTRRLLKLATSMAGNSSGSIPQQTGSGADMKAAYRLFTSGQVTHAAVCRPHFEQTRQAASQLPLVFLLQDTTTLNFTSHAHCQGLGSIGSGPHQRGLHQQNVLAVDPVTRRPLGLMYQRHHRRTDRPAGWRQKRFARRSVPLKQRESYWWIAAIRAIGRPPQGVRWVHVGDRGEDLFGVYDQARRHDSDWLIRVSQDRRILTKQGPDHLLAYARRLPCRIQQMVTVRRGPTRAPEQVQVHVGAAEVQLRPSRNEPGYRGSKPVACWVVRVWEPTPPPGAEPLEWVLCTSLSCATDEDLAFVAQGYSLRWMVEELHKCEKTGCKVEERRLEHTDRLEPLIGLLSILAVWLLQLKFVARDQPKRPAKEVFDEPMVQVMARYLKRSARGLTVGDFWRGIGLLGGHPGRKGDGPIGWLRAWRGWQSFQLIMLGAELSAERRPRGCG